MSFCFVLFFMNFSVLSMYKFPSLKSPFRLERIKRHYKTYRFSYRKPCTNQEVQTSDDTCDKPQLNPETVPSVRDRYQHISNYWGFSSTRHGRSGVRSVGLSGHLSREFTVYTQDLRASPRTRSISTPYTKVNELKRTRSKRTWLYCSFTRDGIKGVLLCHSESFPIFVYPVKWVQNGYFTDLMLVNIFIQVFTNFSVTRFKIPFWGNEFCFCSGKGLSYIFDGDRFSIRFFILGGCSFVWLGTRSVIGTFPNIHVVSSN